MSVIGKRLNGRYKIIEMIGGGGMANVYLAKDVILDRDVAVKVLRPDFSDDDEFINRFRREAHSTTSLDHPNIVALYDVGEEDDIYFIVMEYVNGDTLKKLIQTKGKLSIEESLSIMKQIVSAIAHAHDNQIVHRDIKPHNILLDEFGNIKVTDFGIAMALSSTTITQTNSVLGSVHYLSPEQARGGMANKKSDIYSLGIVFFELLTGRLPFSGESAVSIALKHLQSDVPSPKRWNPSIQQSVENIILKATAKDPFHRYSSAEEMEEDMTTALHPSRLHETRFTIPDDGDEKTKAIPVITDDSLLSQDENTIVRPPLKQKRKKWYKSWQFILTFVAILLGGAIYSAYAIYDSFFALEEVTIPEDIKGKDYNEVFNTLTLLGLKVEQEEEYNPEISAGKVYNTIPSPGTPVVEGSVVSVFVSKGIEPIPFGNYEGRHINDVKKELISLGFKPEYIREFQDPKKNEVAEGIITEQTPKSGEPVIPQDKEVYFVVSTGPPPVDIPDMTGWTIGQVNKFVAEHDLTNLENKETYSDQVPEGQVISQEPKPQTKVRKGTNISLVISKGPEEKQMTYEVFVPFDGSVDIESQEIQIYVRDKYRTFDQPYISDYIEENKMYPVEITVAPGEIAVIQVIRNGQVYSELEFPYSKVSGE